MSVSYLPSYRQSCGCRVDSHDCWSNKKCDFDKSYYCGKGFSVIYEAAIVVYNIVLIVRIELIDIVEHNYYEGVGGVPREGEVLPGIIYGYLYS